MPLCCVSCCAAALHAPPSTRPHPVSFGDPLGLHATPPPLRRVPSPGSSTAAVAALLPLFAAPATSSAAASFDLSQGVLDPASFQPVCPASDGFYRFGQTLVVGLVGADSYKEYAPLIAGGLLRVRLELCVVESFFYEAIIPFVKENGLSWVLPLHETVETFLAGVVFAVATNFILLGSTKIITVLATYADIFFGFPFRIVGGVGWRSLEDNALEALKQAAPEEKPRPWCNACMCMCMYVCVGVHMYPCMRAQPICPRARLCASVPTRRPPHRLLPTPLARLGMTTPHWALRR